MKVSTGVPGFDELIGGGMPEDRLYVISGPPGSGKTTFCTQFVTQGAKQREDSLYVTMHETKAELATDMAGFEFGFDKAITSDAIKFLNLLREEGKQTLQRYGSESGLKGRLVGIIEEMGIDRVVIDSTMLLDYFLNAPEEEATAFLLALKQTDATVLLISEMTDPSSYADEHYLAHGVIFFHNFLEEGGMTRGVQVIKMRGTEIDADIRHIEFTDHGLRVFPDRKVDT